MHKEENLKERIKTKNSKEFSQNSKNHKNFTKHKQYTAQQHRQSERE